MRLANKIGIVTAAASGMGRAGALRFAKEGAAVGVVDLDEAAATAVARQITDAGGKAIALAGDLRQDSFAREIVRRTANAFGGLDFVWNHVGTPWSRGDRRHRLEGLRTGDGPKCPDGSGHH